MARNIIGRFEIRSELGRGAQSVVYLGFDPHLQREVALKTLSLGQQNARQLADSARLMAQYYFPETVKKPLTHEEVLHVMARPSSPPLSRTSAIPWSKPSLLKTLRKQALLALKQQA